MPTLDTIKKTKQRIARLEKSQAMEKIKQRRADTRRKIEFGGLVVKSGMDSYNKSIILGALAHALKSIEEDESYKTLFESIGDNLFLEK